MTRGRPWLLEELSVLRDSRLSHREAARLTGRTRAAVICKRRQLLRDPERRKAEVARIGFRNYKANCKSRDYAEKHRQLWTQEEDDFILSSLSDPRIEVAYALGRTVYAVAQRRRILTKETTS